MGEGFNHEQTALFPAVTAGLLFQYLLRKLPVVVFDDLLKK
jgi:hypothetical protein